MRIAQANWMQVERYLASDDRCVLPIGSVEQHGYLSLATDALLSERVAVEAAEPLGVPVFPVLSYGFTPYFSAYPGTVSLKLATYVALVRDLIASLHGQGFRRVVVVNGHGGNAPAASVAAELMAEMPELQVKFHNWWNAPRTLAFVKALGTGWSDGVRWRDVVVTLSPHPAVRFGSCRPGLAPSALAAGRRARPGAGRRRRRALGVVGPPVAVLVLLAAPAGAGVVAPELLADPHRRRGAGGGGHGLVDHPPAPGGRPVQQTVPRLVGRHDLGRPLVQHPDNVGTERSDAGPQRGADRRLPYLHVDIVGERDARLDEAQIPLHPVAHPLHGEVPGQRPEVFAIAQTLHHMSALRRIREKHRQDVALPSEIGENLVLHLLVF